MLVRKLLNNKSHCTLSVLNYRKAETIIHSMFLRNHVFQGRGPAFRSSPKVDRRFKLLNFTSWYLCLQFFFFKYQHKKLYAPTYFHLKVFTYVMIYVFKEVFPRHNNSVTQKILYCKVTYQSRKQRSFFYIQQRMCVNFLKYSIDFFSTNFIFLDVSWKRSQSHLSKNVSYTIITEKSLRRLTFQSNVLLLYISYFILSFFDLRR